MDRTISPNDPVPRPPRLRPAWTTWMWLIFAVLVVVLTIVGLYKADTIYTR